MVGIDVRVVPIGHDIPNLRDDNINKKIEELLRRLRLYSKILVANHHLVSLYGFLQPLVSDAE